MADSFFTELKKRNVFKVGVAYLILAWVVVQITDTAVPALHLPEWIITAVFFFGAIGFPFALFFAWAFEITPDGIKKESDISPEDSITAHTGRKLDFVIIGLLAVGMGYFFYESRFSTDSEQVIVTETSSETEEEVIQKPEGASIAVLPLVNRSVNPEDAFFADGLHDELLTQLSRISALKVISRTSVMGYAGTTKRMTEIGRELGVAALLEGSVQRSGNRVRINVQLIDAATDEHLWAEIYDRELTANNLFDIQSNITHAIADALKAVLTGDEEQKLEQNPTDNVEAYAFYLRGKAASRGYGRLPAEIDESIAYFQSAIELDPQFAAAHAVLAIDWTERFWTSDRQGGELRHAFDALEQARRLAPELPETLTAEGYYHYWGHLDYAPAITAFDQALKREPHNYLALRGKAYALRRLGQMDEAISVLKKVVSLDPLYADIHADLAYCLLRDGQYKQANIMLNRATVLGAKTSFYLYVTAESLLFQEELEQAWQAIALSSSKDQFQQGFYLDFQLLIARAQSSASRIDYVLDNYLMMDAQSLGAIFSKGLVYLDRDEQDKLNTLIEGLRQNLQTAERERPNTEATQLGFIQLYGLQQDRAKLAKAVKAYYAVVKPDALRIVENRTIPIAYALAGDSEALLAYMDDMVAQFGPWELYYFTIDPSFNSFRDLPRFRALDKRYRQWLEQQF